jgi:hypothetical protein
MSDSTSLYDLVTNGSSGKETQADNLFNANSPAGLFGRRPKTCNGLVWGYYGGTKLVNGVPTKIANGTVTATANVTNYLYEEDGTVSITTAMPTGWPGLLDGNKRALYELAAGASTITSWTDWRTAGHGERQLPRVGTYAYSATLTLDWNKYDVIRVTLTGNATFNHSGGADGARKVLEVTQDATGSRTATWGTGSRFSTTIPSPTLTTSVNKMDRLEWMVSSTHYDLVALLKGY